MTIPQEFDHRKVRPIEVKVEGSSREDFERALKKFKYIFQQERIVGILKEKGHYEKPSEKKRRKMRESQERKFQAARREQMMKTGEWDRHQKKKVQKKINKEERTAEVHYD